MTNTAITAVIQGMNGASLEAMVSPDDRGRGGNGIRRAESSSTVKPETPTNRPYALQGYRGPQDAEGESAIVDGQPLAESVHGAAKIRNRRASDGAYLSKTDAKRASRELKCEKCGKGYKHSSCLTKHLLVPPRSFLPHTFPILNCMLRNLDALSQFKHCQGRGRAEFFPRIMLT